MKEGNTPIRAYTQVEIETPVFLQSVEIGENRGMWSVVGVKAWDSSTSLWQTVYSGQADPDQFAWYQKTEQYNKFAPLICQTTFATSIVRIELDTYSINDWNEIGKSSGVRISPLNNASNGQNDPLGRLY